MIKYPTGKKLREYIFSIIESDWPTSATEIAKQIGFKITEQNQKQIFYRLQQVEAYLLGQILLLLSRFLAMDTL
jgi:hypothetical protein